MDVAVLTTLWALGGAGAFPARAAEPGGGKALPGVLAVRAWVSLTKRFSRSPRPRAYTSSPTLGPKCRPGERVRVLRDGGTTRVSR